MWYCYRRDYLGEPESPHLVMGCWYERASPPDMEEGIPTAYLKVEGEEVRVRLTDFIQREIGKAEYSYAQRIQYVPSVMEQGEPPAVVDKPWFPVCPEGHRGPMAKNPPTEHKCTECETTYPVQTKDSAVVPH